MTLTTSKRLLRGGMAAGAVALLAAPVSAVNIPEGGAVTPDSVFVIHFQVQEGCDGAPTDGLEVTIPDVVSNPLPEEVPGWDVDVVEADPTSGDDGDASGQVVVRWTGGVLEEGAYQEFGLRARFPDEPGSTIAFPVVQRCGTVERAFTEGDDESPAPTVTLTERFGPRDITELSDSVAQMQTEIEDLTAQVGSVDTPNLRSRVRDDEDAIKDLDARVKDLEKQVKALEESAQTGS